MLSVVACEIIFLKNYSKKGMTESERVTLVIFGLLKTLSKLKFGLLKTLSKLKFGCLTTLSQINYLLFFNQLKIISLFSLDY